jgi:thiamine biosynthesis protein ThiS
MTIIVNGQAKEVEAGVVLAELLQQMKLNLDCVAVERNLDVVERDAFASTILSAGDRLEVVQFVGGG